MINVFILNEYPWQFYLLAVCTNVAKHLFHVKTVFCLPEEAFLVGYTCQVSLGGHKREQIFLVQKLEQDSLARKNCHVFAVHRAKKTFQENWLICTGFCTLRKDLLLKRWPYLRPGLHYTGLLSEWVKFCRYPKAVKIFNLRDPHKHANSVKLISICYTNHCSVTAKEDVVTSESGIV
jgi:hypothetical protein